MLKLPEIEDIKRAKAAAIQHEDAGTRLSVYCNFSNCGGARVSFMYVRLPRGLGSIY